MANFSDFLPASGGGGGGIPKYQEFTTSGTFTPSQALIDAGGRVSFLMVAAGGRSDTTSYGGNGGQVKMGYQTLTSTTACAITIGAATTAQNQSGGNTTIAFSSAGGTDEVAFGGSNYYGNAFGPNFSGYNNNSGTGIAAGSGVLGYGTGGAAATAAGAQGWNATYKNYGSGARYTDNSGPGFVRITWFE